MSECGGCRNTPTERETRPQNQSDFSPEAGCGARAREELLEAGPVISLHGEALLREELLELNALAISAS